jgi:5'(3')-deoxyribonucleotidase
LEEKLFSVALDLDDVITHFIDSWLNYYNYKSGDHLTTDKITDWNISKFVLPEWSLKIYDLLKDDCIYEKAEIKDNAGEVIQWLLTKADVFIITAYNYKISEAKGKWVEKYLPFFPIENLIFSNKKHIYNIDYLIDDNYEKVINFNGGGILFQDVNTPWNHFHTNHYPTVHNWSEVQKFFEKEIEELNK